MKFLRNKEAKRTTATVEWSAEETTVKLMKRGHLVNELLKEGAETKVYLDYDEYGEEEWSAEEMAQKEAEVRGKVESLLSLYGPPDGPELSYVLATRHGRKPDGRWKRSYRPYVLGMRVRYTDIPNMIKEAGQDGYWDKTVYKRGEQLLACVNGWKDKEDRRVLLPEPGTEDDLLSYVAQHVEETWPLLAISNSADQILPHGQNLEDGKYAEDLVLRCLKAFRSDVRAEWIRVGIIMKHMGARYEAFEEFSRRSSEYDGSEACWREWTGLRPTGRVGMGTLCMLAKEDNRVAYDEVRREMNERRADAVNRNVGNVGNVGLVEYPESSLSRTMTMHSLTDADAESVREVLKLRDACNQWAWEELEGEGSLKLTAVGCRQCLVDPTKQHADSCMLSVIGGKGKAEMTLSCHVDGRRKLSQAEIRRLQEAFASMWARRAGGMVVQKQKVVENSYTRLLAKVNEYAVARLLRKVAGGEGMVYQPVAGCPCAYVPWMDFKKYINKVCGDDPEFGTSERHVSQLKTYLTDFNKRDFPELEKDQDLLSFANGVLVLSEGRFVEYPAAGDELMGRVARHHIPMPYVGSGETPLFDGLLSAQLSPEVAETLLACMGRLFFEVGTMDNWQVMPYLVGKAGSGKSVVLEIVTAMFASGGVATFNAGQEQIFGLQNKYDKELVRGVDMPQALSKLLEATLLQCMISGEAMSVAIKGQGSIELSKWKVPLIMASNYMPDYLDSEGQISRRLVAFNFRKAVRRSDMMLKEKIISSELPSVVHKALHAYLRMREKHVQEEFYTWCPEELRESRRALRLETDYVRRFLAAGPEDNASSRVSIYVVQREGAHSTMGEFKRAFGKYMAYQHRGVKWTFDEKNLAPFEELGYRVVDANWCKACNREARGGAEKCCESYSKANRTHVIRIVGMKIMREESAGWQQVQEDPLE
jgi:hypothetical protein